jgi:hypothetical protein
MPLLMLLRLLHQLAQDVPLLYPTHAYRPEVLMAKLMTGGSAATSVVPNASSVLPTTNPTLSSTASSSSYSVSSSSSSTFALWQSERWQCDKLTQRVRQHLEDPIAVASRVLPDWCHWLLMECPFLFPLSLRQLYVRLMAFDAYRALDVLERHLVQCGLLTPKTQRQSTPHVYQHALAALCSGGSGGWLMYGSSSSSSRSQSQPTRIPTLKFRVRRDRVMDSAIQVRKHILKHISE